MGKIKVLIIDDSALIRQSITLLFKDDADVVIVGEAANPFEALGQIQNLSPDVLLLDIQMPKMDGLTFLKNIMVQRPMPVIIFSAYAEEGSENAIKAYEYGAVDIIEKPKLNTQTELSKYKEKLLVSIQTAKIANVSNISKLKQTVVSGSDIKINTSLINSEKPEFVIAIGASTGGTEAIKWLLQGIPENFPPILIVQHMPVNFTLSFAKRLNSLASITVKEAEDFEILKNGHAYIARGDRHLTIREEENTHQLILSDSAPVNRHKPSVDVLFESVAENFKDKAIGILLTGMGADGSQSLKLMKDAGAHTIAQDENTCVVFGMPKVAILMGIIDSILPIYKIPEFLIKLVEKILPKE